MAKMLVPALTLPVRGAILFVATMPVPASPSGGQNGMPGCSCLLYTSASSEDIRGKAEFMIVGDAYPDGKNRSFVADTKIM